MIFHTYKDSTPKTRFNEINMILWRINDKCENFERSHQNTKHDLQDLETKMVASYWWLRCEIKDFQNMALYIRWYSLQLQISRTQIRALKTIYTFYLAQSQQWTVLSFPFMTQVTWNKLVNWSYQRIWVLTSYKRKFTLKISPILEKLKILRRQFWTDFHTAMWRHYSHRQAWLIWTW